MRSSFKTSRCSKRASIFLALEVQNFVNVSQYGNLPPKILNRDFQKD